MKQLPILRGKIVNGEIQWQGIDGKRWKVAKDFLEGRECEITIGPKRKRRSLNQNRYLWGCVYALMAEAAGYTPEEMHDACRWHFLQKHDEGPLPTVRSTTELTTMEMEDYLAKCRQLAAEMWGVYVPDPCEVTE